MRIFFDEFSFSLHHRYVEYLGDDVLRKLDAFIKDENSPFQEFQTKLANYHSLAVNAPVEINSTVFTTLFEIDRKEYMYTVVRRLNDLKAMLLDNLIERYQNKVRT